MRRYRRSRFINGYLKPWLRRVAWMGIGAIVAVILLPLFPASLASWIDLGQQQALRLRDKLSATIQTEGDAIGVLPLGQREIKVQITSITTKEKVARFNVDVEAVHASPDTMYYAVLISRDHYVFDAHNFHWSEEELAVPDSRERDISKIRIAEMQKHKRLPLEAPLSDRAIASLMEDYRSLYDARAEEAKRHFEYTYYPLDDRVSLGRFEPSPADINELAEKHVKIVIVDRARLEELMQSYGVIGYYQTFELSRTVPPEEPPKISAIFVEKQGRESKWRFENSSPTEQFVGCSAMVESSKNDPLPMLEPLPSQEFTLKYKEVKVLILENPPGRWVNPPSLRQNCHWK